MAPAAMFFAQLTAFRVKHYQQLNGVKANSLVGQDREMGVNERVEIDHSKMYTAHVCAEMKVLTLAKSAMHTYSRSSREATKAALLTRLASCAPLNDCVSKLSRL